MEALYKKAKGAEIWERSWGQGSGAKDFKKYIYVLIVWAASHVGS